MRIASLNVRPILIVIALLATRSAAAQQAAAPTPAPATVPGAPAPPPDAPPPAGYPPPYGYAQQPAPPVAPPPEKRLGVGYKIGNGLGFMGADLVVAPINHLAFDLQVNYLSFKQEMGMGTATGWGIAPGVQGRLFAGQVSTPYAALGMIYAKMSLDELTGSIAGFFLNAGYEWRWESGLGILLGGGVARYGGVHVTNGVDTIDRPGGTAFNIEAGLRYMFL